MASASSGRSSRSSATTMRAGETAATPAAPPSRACVGGTRRFHCGDRPECRRCRCGGRRREPRRTRCRPCPTVRRAGRGCGGWWAHRVRFTSSIVSVSPGRTRSVGPGVVPLYVYANRCRRRMAPAMPPRPAPRRADRWRSRALRVGSNGAPPGGTVSEETAPANRSPSDATEPTASTPPTTPRNCRRCRHRGHHRFRSRSPSPGRSLGGYRIHDRSETCCCLVGEVVERGIVHECPRIDDAHVRATAGGLEDDVARQHQAHRRVDAERRFANSGLHAPRIFNAGRSTPSLARNVAATSISVSTPKPCSWSAGAHLRLDLLERGVDVVSKLCIVRSPSAAARPSSASMARSRLRTDGRRNLRSVAEQRDRRDALGCRSGRRRRAPRRRRPSPP